MLYAAIHNPMKTGVAGRRLASVLDETRSEGFEKNA